MIEIPEWYNASVLVDGNLEAGRADKVAIYCGDEEVTYGELARRMSRFGHALRALGVDREDRVLLMLNDTPSFPTAFLLYSSGSTGKPKGAVHLHHDIIYTCETYARHVLEVSEEDVCFSASKLFHAYGLGNNISFPYWAGASTVLFPGKPTPDVILGTAQRFEPTLFFSVPTLYNAMLNREGAGDYDLSSIRLCVSAAEALPAGIWRRWKEM